jgi:thiol-disulfide isomerase/thioredoxin/uncharacterized membrane protein YphA (DoxX/SURF4 family)
MTALLLLARVLLAGVFTVSGLAKLRDRDGTAKAARDFGVPASLSNFTARALPVVELLLAIGLIPRITAGYAAWSIGALLVAFTIAIAASILSGRQTVCHCFGESSNEPVGWSSVLRNVALLAMAAFIAWPRDAGAGPGPLDLWNAVDSAARPALGVAIVSVLIAIAAAYACLGLLRQHGRMLLRIDALEAAAAARSVTGAPSAQSAQPRHIVPAGVPSTAATSASKVPVGSPVPAFSLPRLDGTSVTDAVLKSFGRPTLLLFTDPNCGPCNTIAPDLDRWAAEHGDQYAMVLVTRGDLAANKKKYGESAAAHVIHDKELVLANAIGTVPTPSAVTLSADGRVQSDVVMGQHGIEALIAAITGAAPRKADAVSNLGRMFPAFDVARIDGGRVTNAVFRGKKSLVLFWNPGCGYCAQMLPGLQQWAESRRNGAPDLVLMSAGAAADHERLGLQAVVGFDDGFAMGNVLGVPGTPSGVLVDAEGKFASEIAVGEGALWKLLGGKPAEVAAG